MAVSDDDSVELVERYKQGDQRAAGELFERYVERLTALAHSRLSNKLARRIDAEDVVQSAYRSFFVRARDGGYDLRNTGDLWRLLAVITLNKLRRKVEHHTAGKRKVDVEQSGGRDDTPIIVNEAITREPSPGDTLAVLEEVEQLTKDMTDVQRQMLELRLQGYRLEEIAEELGRSERTVRRVLDRIRERLEERIKIEEE